MQTEINMAVSPETASYKELIQQEAARQLSINPSRITGCRIIRRSIDARSRNVKINLKLLIIYDEPAHVKKTYEYKTQNVTSKPGVIIVGSGPAGLFAALRLIESGIKPVILERGKDVRSRKRDIALISREHIVNPDSNYCFGEGGAGTFSDGKLFTRSKKRGNINRILNLLAFHGASENILIDVHAHIGTDKLPAIIRNIRNTILECGGEIHFEKKVTDLIISDNTVKGVKLHTGESVNGCAVILATGHSANDMYYMLNNKQIALEAKPFAMGVRVEHPQQLIDTVQYSTKNPDKHLPAAMYNLSTNVYGRGVYSFCMCPGGFIIPSATSPNQVVVNGMSPSHRGSGYSNSGIVVEIRLEDIPSEQHSDVLKGLKYRTILEEMAAQNGGRGQVAPAQRIVDFVKGKISSTLPYSSYFPGIVTSPVHFWLPEFIGSRLQKAFIQFNKKLRGFTSPEAVLIGLETRTSSPVKIPRNDETLEHIQISRLYPCGEGSGYAGGIISSAIDGERCAEKIINTIIKSNE